MLKRLALTLLLTSVSFASSLVSVSPSTGYARPGEVVAFTFRIIFGGGGNAGAIQVKFGSDPSATASTCHLLLNVNEWGLLNDAGDSFQGRIGFYTGNTYSNSQCSVQAHSGSVPVVDGAYEYTMRVTFTEAFKGPKTIYWGYQANSGYSVYALNNVAGAIVVGVPVPKVIVVSQ